MSSNQGGSEIGKTHRDGDSLRHYDVPRGEVRSRG